MNENGLVADGSAGDGGGVWTGLLESLRLLGPLAVAYSGGVDSRFLVHAALRAGVVLELIHVCGPHVAAEDTQYALDWAREQGLSVQVLSLDPLVLPEVARGDRDRCYACKTFLFRSVMTVATGLVCDGSNASDAVEYRPGRRALQELGVRSPLAEAGLTKDGIRSLALRTGMSRPQQQSRACLLTRLPYGMPPQPGLLGRAAEGERLVEQTLREYGEAEQPFRLRLCDVEKWELHLAGKTFSDKMLQDLELILRAEGFGGVVIRIMPSLSGYFDRMQKIQGS